MKISALVHTKNSAGTIEQALKSVAWADEIVVIDAHSTDDTVAICKEYTDTIFMFDDDIEYVEPARNFGISKATSDWIVILDADEEIPETLAKKIKKLTEMDTDVWELPRKNMLFGHWVKNAGWWPDYNVRFFRNGFVDWPKQIHAQPETRGKRQQLPAEEDLAILHHNYPSVSEFISRMNKYTSITVAEKRGASGSALTAFWNEFQSRFLAKNGYNDGIVGLHASILQSCYEAVIRIKQWEADNAPNMPINVADELEHISKEIAYWRADYMTKHTVGIKQLCWRLRRKLKL
jgi:glycosyltransferase involved in cell wall biosynthesis